MISKGYTYTVEGEGGVEGNKLSAKIRNAIMENRHLRPSLFFSSSFFNRKREKKGVCDLVNREPKRTTLFWKLGSIVFLQQLHIYMYRRYQYSWGNT